MWRTDVQFHVILNFDTIYGLMIKSPILPRNKHFETPGKVWVFEKRASLCSYCESNHEYFDVQHMSYSQT